MAAHMARRALALYSIPLSGSLGGGLAQVSHGNSLTTVIVALGPTTLSGLVLFGGVLVYRAEQHRYLNADPKRQQAIREHNAHLVNIAVALLTLKRIQAADTASSRPQRRTSNSKRVARDVSDTAGRRAVPTGRQRVVS